jgi:hypothetical protein
MAPYNCKNLSISIPNVNSTAKAEAKAMSKAKPTSTLYLGSRRVRSKWLGTIIPAAPILPPDFNPTYTQACSPTSPFPVMAPKSQSMSLAVLSPPELEYFLCHSFGTLTPIIKHPLHANHHSRRSRTRSDGVPTGFPVAVWDLWPCQSDCWCWHRTDGNREVLADWSEQRAV